MDINTRRRSVAPSSSSSSSKTIPMGSSTLHSTDGRTSSSNTSANTSSSLPRYRQRRRQRQRRQQQQKVNKYSTTSIYNAINNGERITIFQAFILAWGQFQLGRFLNWKTYFFFVSILLTLGGLIIFMGNNYNDIVTAETRQSQMQQIQVQNQQHQIINPNAKESQTPPLLLNQFSTLNYPLTHAKIVGLYFAASWCPMSTPVSQSLDELFSTLDASALSNRILRPPPPTIDDANPPPPVEADLAIVYISSDKTQEEMNSYLSIPTNSPRNKYWHSVPFSSSDKNNLKRHFKTCAAIEIDDLDITRRFEIPSLHIIDTLTHGILSTDGVEDMKREKDDVLDYWLILQERTRRLEERMGLLEKERDRFNQ